MRLLNAFESKTETEEKMVQKHDRYVAGASTFSKSIYRFPEQYPKFISKAKGCYVWDTNDNKYVDYVSSLGAITLGYNDNDVNTAVKAQIDKGNLFSLVSDIEAECAEILCNATTSDKCMFVKTGTDATNAAVRLAMAYTNRNGVLYCSHGYHGWGDWFGAGQTINKGVDTCLQHNISKYEYDNIGSLEQALTKNTAAVIMEPITYVSPETVDYFKEVRDAVHDNGSLFIMDEIVTFPRFSHFGLYHQIYGINADMSCIGKGIGNGYSISCVVGNEDILNQRTKEEVFISGTFFGETIGMVAAIETLKKAHKTNLSAHILYAGTTLCEGFNRLAQEKNVPITMYGEAPRMILKYPNIDIKSLFLQETAKHAVILGNIIYPTLCHNNRVIQDTLEKCDEVLDNIAFAIEYNAVKSSIIGRGCRDLQIRK